MSRTILAMLLFAGLGAASLPEPVDAAQTRAKARRAADSQTSERRVAVARTERKSDAARGPELRDRSTYYSRDGKLNGREFFDQLNERSSGAGD